MFSVKCALGRIGVEAEITDDKEKILAADKVIFPGVGEASSAMSYLRGCGLDSLIKSLKQPVLGICIGMQLLCKSSEEGDTGCLGVFDVPVKRFVCNPGDGFKIPHMGWNTISQIADNGVISEELGGQYVYFVHSYYVPVCEYTIAQSDYIHPFSAALHKDNFYATQFHPEKSGSVGEMILKKFIEL